MKVNGLKKGYAVATNSAAELYAYDPEKFYLSRTDDQDELVTLYRIENQGMVDYDKVVKLPRRDLTPNFVSASGLVHSTIPAMVVRYTTYPSETFVFRYNPLRESASVAYPDGHTRSESDDGDIPDIEAFRRYCERTIGQNFVGNLSSIFNYLFRKNVNLDNYEFSLDAAVLTGFCMSDQEQRDARNEATRISSQIAAHFGQGLNLDEFQESVIGRHRPDVYAHLERFNSYAINL